MRSFLGTLGVAILLAFAVVAVVLVEAHWEIRSLSPPLPSFDNIQSLAKVADGPIRISYINTSTQTLPEDKTLAHPAYLIEWANGQNLLIDAGMDRRQALVFGQNIESFTGAGPAEALGSVAEQMGDLAKQIGAVAFTHLHQDHTNGVISLCRASENGIRLLQTVDQGTRGNYSTRPGQDFLAAADCLTGEEIPAGRLASLADFPGVRAMPAAGHTPGSTIFLVPVAGKIWILSGDVSNAKHDLLHDIPKPVLYSLLLVPESTGRLALLRQWLATLDERDGIEVVVSHDIAATKASGMQAWKAPD